MEAAVSEQEVAELRQQVPALLQRVEQLEARNQALAAGAAPAAKIDKLELRVADVEATSEAQTDLLAQAAATARSAEWAPRLKWTADFPYRHEDIWDEGRADRTRHRIRARLGLEAKINDDLKGCVGIATGNPEDPRSRTATLGDGAIRKTIALDFGYIDWTIREDVVLSLGKMPYPFERIGGSLFHDSDANPEGAALRFEHESGFFGSGYGFWISESSSGADANVFGTQLGWAGLGGLMVSVGYNDYGALQNNSVGLVDLGGNSTYGAANANCSGTGSLRCYLYDYDILEVGAEYGFRVGQLPVLLWADYLENTAVDDLNTAFALGARLGRARDPGSWKLGLLYAEVEQDAQWGGVVDSNFGGGATQAKGFQLTGGWAPAKNVLLSFRYFDNVRNFDKADERDYERLQLDLNFKF